MVLLPSDRSYWKRLVYQQLCWSLANCSSWGGWKPMQRHPRLQCTGISLSTQDAFPGMSTNRQSTEEIVVAHCLCKTALPLELLCLETCKKFYPPCFNAQPCCELAEVSGPPSMLLQQLNIGNWPSVDWITQTVFGCCLWKKGFVNWNKRCSPQMK